MVTPQIWSRDRIFPSKLHHSPASRDFLERSMQPCVCRRNLGPYRRAKDSTRAREHPRQNLRLPAVDLPADISNPLWVSSKSEFLRREKLDKCWRHCLKYPRLLKPPWSQRNQSYLVRSPSLRLASSYSRPDKVQGGQERYDIYVQSTFPRELRYLSINRPDF